jgi:RNA polymerase sigma-70 factor (ECF subfamily)
MSEENAFRALISRIRTGDQQAMAELVRRYEPALRRAVRLWLRDPHLRRLLDSTDVCQSVLLNFFAAIAAGRYLFDTPEEMLRLLTVMARNQVVNDALRHRAERRDHRRASSADPEELAVPDPGPSPDQYVAAQELLQKARHLLTPEERQLLELREQGLGWAEIATARGVSPEALRKQLARAVSRAARTLGLDRADP